LIVICIEYFSRCIANVQGSAIHIGKPTYCVRITVVLCEIVLYDDSLQILHKGYISGKGDVFTFAIAVMPTKNALYTIVFPYCIQRIYSVF